VSYTYAIMRVSEETYAEIREHLIAAGYADQIHERAGSFCETLDMHGIALQVTPQCPEDEVP